MNSSTRSVDDTPICHPMLPPVILTNTGSLHVLSAPLTLRTPLPCLPPMPSPAFLSPGITMMAAAFSTRLRGGPSDIAANSWMTVAESLTRLVSSLTLSSPALVSEGAASVVTRARIRMRNFMRLLLPGLGLPLSYTIPAVPDLGKTTDFPAGACDDPEIQNLLSP